MSDGISDRFKQKRRVEEDSDRRERVAETMDNRSKQDIDEAEKEFNGFIWKGCGWYFTILARVIRLNAREIYNCDPSDMSISIKFNCDESEYLVMVYRNKGCMLKGYGYSMNEAFRNCLTEFCVEVDKRISSMRETINSLENSIKPFKD